MDFTQGKALISSKVFWGALLALIAIVANAFGFTGVGTWAGNAGTVDWIVNLIGVFGTVLALFGRATASVPITGILKPK